MSAHASVWAALVHRTSHDAYGYTDQAHLAGQLLTHIRKQLDAAIPNWRALWPKQDH